MDNCINSRVCNYDKRVMIGPLRTIIIHFFYILDLNMNEWVPVKGRMKVVSSNSVSVGSLAPVRYQDLGARQPKTEIFWVDGLSTGPSKIGAYSLVSELRYTNT